MKKTMILETLAAALLAFGQAHAAPVSLEGASIAATYQGSGDNIFGFYGSAGDPSNVSGLDPQDTFVEFMTGDALFGFDFSPSGLLTVETNDFIPPPDPNGPGYTFTFDFGNALSAPITSFTLVDGTMITAGVPGLSVLSDHSIGLDLTQLTWSDQFSALTAQLNSDSAPSNVPEPASLALVLAGAAGLRLTRRARRG